MGGRGADAVSKRNAATQPKQRKQLIKGFHLLRLPLTAGSPLSRSLLVKRHEARTVEEKAAGEGDRTLFVTHLDNFTTEAKLSRCFAAGFGPVERVELKSAEKKQALHADQRADAAKSYVNFARVVFREAASLQKALEAATGKVISTAVLPLPSGALADEVKAQESFYREPTDMRREVDEWFAGYDERVEERKKAEVEETVVDEDGFILVKKHVKTDLGFNIKATRGPKKDMGAFSEPMREAGETAPEKKKRVKHKEKPDFYRFQQREKRMQGVIEHRKQSEEDRKTMYQLKKQKKFKEGEE